MTIGFILFCWLAGVLITDYQDARLNEKPARDRAKREEIEEAKKHSARMKELVEEQKDRETEAKAYITRTKANTKAQKQLEARFAPPLWSLCILFAVMFLDTVN